MVDGASRTNARRKLSIAIFGLCLGLLQAWSAAAEKIIITLTIPNPHGTISTATGPGQPFTSDLLTLTATSDTSALDTTSTTFHAPIEISLSGLPSGTISDPAARISIEPNGMDRELVRFGWPALSATDATLQGAYAQYPTSVPITFQASFTSDATTGETFSALTTGGQFAAALSDGRTVSVGAGPGPATVNVAVGELPPYPDCFGTTSVFVVAGSPATPGPADVIAYTVNLPSRLVSAFTHETRIFSRTTVGATNQGGTDILADVVIGTDATLPPGYEVSASAVDDYDGHLGPLNVGSYLVTPTVRVALADDSGFQTVCPQVQKFSTLTVSTLPGVTHVTPAVEYYWPSRDHYFVTADPAEIAALDSGALAGWVRTGQTFAVYLSGQSNKRGRPVSRYYGLPSANLDTHFYSASVTENKAMQQSPFHPSWTQESPNIFEIATPNTLTGVCPVATIPVYRLWNNRPDSNHRYTTDITIRQQMIAQGYSPEGYGPLGVVFCSPQT
jgi:Repeat of unknown function (DUF5648)